MIHGGMILYELDWGHCPFKMFSKRFLRVLKLYHKLLKGKLFYVFIFVRFCSFAKI